MKMSLEKELNSLLRAGKIKHQGTESAYIEKMLESAHRNFEAAKLVRGEIEEAEFKLIYDGLLQISRAILLLNGYRPDDGEQHKTTFYVAGLILGKEYNDLIARIQRFRIKRNNCIYEPQGFVSQSEADAILSVSKEFWHKAKQYLRKKDPQLKLFE